MICDGSVNLVGIVELQRQSKYAEVWACDDCEWMFFKSDYLEDSEQLYRDLLYCQENSEAISQNSECLLKSLAINDSSARFLDIGCGAGFFVKILNENGFEAHGVDLNPYCIKFARETLGLKNIHDYLFDTTFPFDVNYVTLIGVLEHLANPKTLIEEVHTYGQNKNLNLFINVPWIEYKRDKQKIENLKKCDEYPFMDNSVHINHFSQKSIEKLCASIGFRNPKWINGPLPGILFTN
jgi:SAM-dependent methyltransferase